MLSRFGSGLGAALAAIVVLSLSVAAAESGDGTMTVEEAKKLPGVVSVTQADGSVAYYKDYNDYNAGKPVAVESGAVSSAQIFPATMVRPGQGTNAATTAPQSASSPSPSIPPTPSKGSDDYYTVVGPNGMTAAEEDALMQSLPTSGPGAVWDGSNSGGKRFFGKR